MHRSHRSRGGPPSMVRQRSASACCRSRYSGASARPPLAVSAGCLSRVTTQILLDVRRATWQPMLGISRYARSLARAILDHRPPDLAVRLLDLSGSGWPPEHVQLVGAGSSMIRRLLQEQIAMPRRALGADVLHLPWYEGPLIPPCRLVLNVHDLDTIENAHGYSWRFRAYYNALLRVHIRQAAAVIVPSRATRDAVSRKWPRAPLVHIPYGVDEVFFGDDEQATAEREPAILYTGGFGYRKRVGDLLQAFHSIGVRHRDVKLLITGSAPADVRSLVRAHPLSHRIDFTGYVDDLRLARLYRTALIVVYPSMLEGFGFPVLEAFAAATAVVAARSGSIPEIAGDAALLVPPRSPAELGDAIEQLLGDAGLRATLQTRGRERAEQYSWARTLEDTLALYREVA